MTHTIDTSKYERIHSHKPHGQDTWVFIYDKNTKSLFNGLWHDATMAALRFRRLGNYERVEVQA